MNPWTGAVSDLLSHGDLPTTLGWLFAAAMVVGGILNDGGKELLRWLLCVLVFSVFLVLGLETYLTAQNHPYYRVVTLVFLTGILYCCGLAFGWAIVWIARWRVRKEYQRGSLTGLALPVIRAAAPASIASDAALPQSTTDRPCGPH